MTGELVAISVGMVGSVDLVTLLDDNAGAILAFCGAVIVSVVAAVTAGRRQRRDHDHALRLAEAERVRDVIDEAAAVGQATYDALMTAQLSLRAADPADAEEVERCEGFVAAAKDSQTQIAQMQTRLALRFPVNGPVYERYNELRETMRQACTALGQDLERLRRGEASRDDLREVMARCYAASNEFASAVRPVVGFSDHGPVEARRWLPRLRA